MAYLPLGLEEDSRPDDRFRLYGHREEIAIPARPKSNPVRRSAILAAAHTCFWKSGIRRTSIEDVANEAGLAKGTIYLYFDSKEELFAALAAKLCEESLGGVAAALAAPGPLARRLAGALDAKIGHFHRLLAGSAHAAELLDESASIAATHLDQLDRAFHAAIEKALAGAKLGLDPKQRGELLEQILAAGYGIARQSELSDRFDAKADRARLERHVELLLRGSAATRRARRASRPSSGP
jgi:AcrR family transcriptional regulator